jgi:hypothetical protein
VKQKLAVPGNEPGRLGRLADGLVHQLRSELRPVLRDPDFAEFDLDRAFATVLEVAAALGYRP